MGSGQGKVTYRGGEPEFLGVLLLSVATPRGHLWALGSFSWGNLLPDRGRREGRGYQVPVRELRSPDFQDITECCQVLWVPENGSFALSFGR